MKSITVFSFFHYIVLRNISEAHIQLMKACHVGSGNERDLHAEFIYHTFKKG